MTMLKLLKSSHKETITFRILLTHMYTTSKLVVEIFSLNDGKVKLLNLELVRRIIIRERKGVNNHFSSSRRG
jgi:hypothetical protein